MQSREGEIKPLTSVRFFAALYVVLFHTLSPLVRGSDDPNAVYGGVLGLGYVSVSFFFVLSGYILAKVYLPKRSHTTPRAFWMARFARIYPLFFITLLADTPHLFMSILRRHGSHAAVTATAKILLANTVMVQGWFVHLRGIDNPNWSLSVEAFFYALFPLLLLWLARQRNGSLLVISGITYCIGLAAIVVASHAFLRLDTVKFSPLLHLHEFVEGMCIGICAARLSPGTLRTLERASPVMLAICAASFILFVTLSWHMLSMFTLIHDGLLSPLFLLLIVSLNYGDSFIHRALSDRRFVLVGEASYGLYLWHIPLWHVAKMIPGGQNIWLYPLFVAGAIAFSVLSLQLLERPARNLVLSKMRARQEESLMASSIAQ